MVQRHNINNGNGDGSGEQIDDMYDNEEYRHKAKQGPNHTYYSVSDVKNNVSDERTRRSLLRAMSNQEGQHTPANVDDPSPSEQNNNEWKFRITNAFTSQLGMGTYQKDRCQYIWNEVTVQRFGPYSTEEVLLGIILHVAKEENRGGHGTEMVERDDFQHLVDSADTTVDRVVRTSEILVDRMDESDNDELINKLDE